MPVMRLVVEMFREPDAHLGFIFLESITMGQIHEYSRWTVRLMAPVALSKNPPLLGADASNEFMRWIILVGYARIR